MNKTITLTNGRGEQISVTLNVEGRRISTPTPTRCDEVVITVIDSSEPVELDAGVRALFAVSGGLVPVNNWSSDGQRIVCTRGDIKRLGTYPIFIYAGGDKTKKGRYQLRNIDGIDRFNLRKLV